MSIYSLTFFFLSVDVSPSEKFLQGGKPPSITVQSAGHTLHVFINGQLSGKLSLSVPKLNVQKSKGGKLSIK